MLEISTEGRETSQNLHLVLVSDIDFEQPWLSIVEDVNKQLNFQGYKGYDPKVPRKVILSNLNIPRSTPLKFDTLRVSEDVKGEDYSPLERAVAKLGLQSTYWKFIYEALRETPGGFYISEYQKVSCPLIFKKGSKFYFRGDRIRGSTKAAQFAGDYDMIHAIQRRAMSIEGVDIPFSTFGLSGDYERYLDQYIDCRDNISKAEKKARIDAISLLGQDEKLMEELRAVFPKADEAFEDPKRYGSSIFLDFSEEIVSTLFPADTSSEMSNVRRMFSTILTDKYLKKRMIPMISNNLYFNPDFLQSFRGLAISTELIYDSALQELQLMDLRGELTNI